MGLHRPRRQHRFDVWAKKFQELLDRFPGGHWLWVADGTIHLMRYGGNGNRIYDPDAVIAKFDFDKVDGGDWNEDFGIHPIAGRTEENSR